MAIPRSLALTASRERKWSWMFWGSILACEVVGVILSRQM